MCVFDPRGKMAEGASSQAQLEVTERRLRPLYDALDYGQHKKALQIADKILKKQSDLKCAKILKAIALVRLSREEEAHELVRTVLSSHPGEQATLQALTLFYREIGDFQKIAEVYADAAKHYPKNQEILTHLFMAYVRVGDCAKQQQVAAQLCKAYPTNGPYQCWRVMSVLMQATETGSAELAKSMYFPLADKLISKYFKEHKVDAEAEVRLYLMVLTKLGAKDRVLELLQGKTGEPLRDPWEIDTLIVASLQDQGLWEAAAEKLVAMLEINPDSWVTITAYIHGQLERSLKLRKETVEESSKDDQSQNRDTKEGDSPANQEPKNGKEGEAPINQEPKDGKEGDSPSQDGEAPANQEPIKGWLRPLIEVRDLMERLAAAELKKFDDKELVVRGPLLGRLELVRAVTQTKEKIDIELGSPYEHLMDYFRLFGTKNCVYDDLVKYVTLGGLPGDHVERFLREVDDQTRGEPIDFDCPPDKIKENLCRMRRHISLLQLQRHVGLHELPLQHKQELVAMCLHHFRAGLRLGVEFRDTSCQPADYYIILAVHLKIELYHETGDVRHVWEGVIMLEGVVNHNTQVVLLLMKLYGHLGVSEAITDLYNNIGIKHVQTVTLGHIPSRYLQAMGTFGFAGQLYRSAFRFFFSSSKEVSEYVIQCFKNGMFHKIPEMIEMRDRLSHSFNFACTMVDMNTLELHTTVHSYSEAVTFFQKEWSKGMPYTTSSLRDYCSRLVDSRDLSVLEDWSPPSTRLSDVEIKITFDLECLWLRTRICLLKCLHSALSCLTSEKAAKDEKLMPKMLRQQIDELCSTLESVDQHVGTMLLKQRAKHQLHPIQSPPPCLGYLFHTEGHGGVLCLMLTTVYELLSGSTSLREKLESILMRLQAIKSRIKCISPDLREAMIRIAAPSLQEDGDGGGDEGIVITSPFDAEHPYDIITRSRIDLEEYVLFLQTVGILSLLCTICAEFIAPTFTGGKKKRKKKAAEQLLQPRHPASDELVDFMKELMLLLSSTSLSFQPFPSPPGQNEEALIQQLRDLYLSHSAAALTGATYTQSPDNQDPYLKAWREGAAKACGVALSSYNMSFRDTLEVATAKLQTLRATIKQLGGHIDG